MATADGQALHLAATAASGDSASDSGTQADFNGDGYRDLAASAPDATIDGHSGAGAVTIAYGSAGGAGATDAQRVTISQNTAGVPGAAESADHFGQAVATGDFNGDGYADLAVGTPGEDVTGDNDAGIVQVLWGSTAGLSGGTTLADPAPFDHDAHGRALAAGDFDGDGKDDLATGNTSSQAWLYGNGISTTGQSGGTYPLGVLNAYNGEVIALTSGDLTGDGADDLLVNHTTLYVSGGDASTLGLGLYGEAGRPGYSSVFGDFNNDGYGDIVVGSQGNHGGEYTYLPGAPASQTDPSWSVNYDRSYTLTQENDVPGEPGLYDRFGAGLAAGDINGDGYDDLAIGDPGEDIGTVPDAGHVVVSYGASLGLTNNYQSFDQGTEGVPGSNETGDGFGSQLLLTDLNADGKADLTVAATGENDGNGALTFLPGSDINITVTGARSLTPTSFGLPTAGQPHLGSGLR